MTVHMFDYPMTGLLSTSWAYCGAVCSDLDATTWPSRVTCPACKRAMKRDRKRVAERKGGKA